MFQRKKLELRRFRGLSEATQVLDGPWTQVHWVHNQCLFFCTSLPPLCFFCSLGGGRALLWQFSKWEFYWEVKPYGRDEHEIMILVLSSKHYKVLIFRKQIHCCGRKTCFLFLICFLLIKVFLTFLVIFTIWFQEIQGQKPKRKAKHKL